MSSSDNNILKNNSSNKNNSKLNCNNLIEYSKEKNNEDFYGESFFEKMKKGYIEMAEINLQLARESELLDISNYETWLSGEWFVKWRLWW